MMPGWLQDWWGVIALVLTVAVIPGARWAARKGLASADDLAAARRDLDGRVNQVERRLTDQLVTITTWMADHRIDHARLDGQLDLLRQSVTALPTGDQLAALNTNLTELRGDVRGLGVAVDGVQRAVEQVDKRVARHEAIFASAAQTAKRERVS